METKEVEYFGINIDSIKIQKVIRKNEFTNFLRNDFINGMEKPLMKLKEEYWPYMSCPMLFSRFDLLNFYTQKMDDNSFITNSSTMKVLANIHFVDSPIPESKNHHRSQPKLPLTKDNDRSFIIFPTKKLMNNILKTFYVLHVEPDPTISAKKFEQNAHAQKCLEATLKNKVDEFQTFGCYCKTLNVGNSSINVYYTQKIDLFDNEMNPIKVKALLLKEKTEKALKQKLSENENEMNIDTVFKCKTGGIKKVIFGIHDGTESKMIHKDLKELDIGHVVKEVKIQLGTMKKNLHDIIQIYLTNNNLKGKAFRIRYENQWTFDEINLQNLLLSYNRL